MHHGNRVKSAFVELGSHSFRVDGLTPLNLHFVCLLTAALSHVIPFVRKCSAAQIKYLRLHEVANGAFHDSPS